MQKSISNKIRYRPIFLVQVYLWTTFLLFLASNYAREIDNILQLFLFLCLAYGMLFLGYIAGVKTSKWKYIYDQRSRFFRIELFLIYAGIFYYFIWGINQIYDFGGSFSTVLSTIIDPGASYKAKFDVYDKRLAENSVNNITRILIVFSFFYAAFIPVLISSWKFIGLYTKTLGFVGLSVYVLSFLSIGTQKGIGDVVLMSIAGSAVYIVCGHEKIRKKKRRFLLLAMPFILLSFGYMAVNQASRAKEFGITESRMFGDVSDTVLADVLGDELAYGVYALVGYPSHGYAGLSYNLEQPFAFSYGAGFSQAFESHRAQIFGGNNNLYLTYPYRTEVATGWPAGMYWSTIFPWIASDLTFFGAIIFMFFIGILFSRTWLCAIGSGSTLSRVALGQIIIFLAFIPANNQILMSRQGLWVVISIIFVFATSFVLKKADVIRSK